MKIEKFKMQRIMWSGLPFLLALILALLCGEKFFSSGKSCFIEINKITLDLEGTLLGFIITVVSILVAFNGSRLTEEVKQSSLCNILLRHFHCRFLFESSYH